RLHHRQRIRRGGRPAAQVHAAGAGLFAVRADLHRAGGSQADADAAAEAGGTLMAGNEALYLRRRLSNGLAMLFAVAAALFGLFVYAMVVVPMGHFSAFAGAISLAFIALPVIVRTTDEMLRLVPVQMREAALSLGVPQWKLTVQVLYRAALPGIVTGVLLALARISGETAPLLFTAHSNQLWSSD